MRKSIQVKPTQIETAHTDVFTHNRVPRWKRCLDIVCLVLASPLVIPLCLAVALCLKIGSRGSLLFKQERIGYVGRPFIIFKFRTMTADSEVAVHEKYVADLIKSNQPMTKLDSRGDARVVPLGRFFRATGLDELPQILNVFRGEMSLVGPRPCVVCEFERYLPCQRERLNTLPGITGLWQVSGKNRLSFTEMIEHDLRYVRTKSVRLDIWIILITIPAVLNEIRLAKRTLSETKATGNERDQCPDSIPAKLIVASGTAPPGLDTEEFLPLAGHPIFSTRESICRQSTASAIARA